MGKHCHGVLWLRKDLRGCLCLVLFSAPNTECKNLLICKPIDCVEERARKSWSSVGKQRKGFLQQVLLWNVWDSLCLLLMNVSAVELPMPWCLSPPVGSEWWKRGFLVLLKGFKIILQRLCIASNPKKSLGHRFREGLSHCWNSLVPTLLVDTVQPALSHSSHQLPARASFA